MAMLAEPRRKQKLINLRAKNNDWSNDANKFGQKMLEKMGWSTGKGLGAKENGIVEHVIAKYKNDEAGLGYVDKNDQWTKHEDDFNKLLSNLSNSSDKEPSISGVSLEVKSKKSKARVHYHKFTRGKDLSRYSAKDLANIFGKKSLKIENVIQETNAEVVKTTGNLIFTERGSMKDYFNSKMKDKKQLTDSPVCDNEVVDFAFRGFAGTNFDANCNKAESENFDENIGKDKNCIETAHNGMIVGSSKAKKKKSKKDKSENEGNPVTGELTGASTFDANHNETDLQNTDTNSIQNDNHIETPNNVLVESIIAKKKKSKKHKRQKEESLEESYQVEVKTKKRKLKDTAIDNEMEKLNETKLICKSTPNLTKKKKSKKKDKNDVL